MEKVLSLYKHPKNFHKPERVTHQASHRGRICGDQIELFLDVIDGTVRNAGFTGNCCAITTAVASELTDRIKGLSLENLDEVTTESIVRDLEIMVPSARIECAELPRETLLRAVLGDAQTE